MARGKQATMAANRRAEAAHEVIDRLTSEVAELKIRAREAEHRADRLEGIEAALSTADIKRDDLIVELTRKLQWWSKVAGEDQARREAAREQMFRRLCPDLFDAIDPNMPLEDRRQFLVKRYGAVMAALCACDESQLRPDSALPVHGTNTEVFEKKLSQESLRKFQRLSAQRAVFESAPDRDAADVLNDLLDARQAGFDPADVLDYALSESGK
jgi:hypothetical protein